MLNEVAPASGVGIKLTEEALPVRSEVFGVCEMLGIDPLYVACEGRMVVIVDGEYADDAVDAMRAHPMGRESAVIGEVRSTRGPRPRKHRLRGHQGGRHARRRPPAPHL